MSSHVPRRKRPKLLALIAIERNAAVPMAPMPSRLVESSPSRDKEPAMAKTGGHSRGIGLRKDG